MAKKSTRTVNKENAEDERSELEKRVEIEKNRDISKEIASIDFSDIAQLSYADVGERILKKVNPLFWKVLATNIFKLKFPDSLDMSASRLSEIYTDFCLDGRFQFQKGHLWTLTCFLPQETKRVKRASTVNKNSKEG